jgi:hypothetical protein
MMKLSARHSPPPAAALLIAASAPSFAGDTTAAGSSPSPNSDGAPAWCTATLKQQIYGSAEAAHAAAVAELHHRRSFVRGGAMTH